MDREMDAWSNSIRITKRTIRWRQRGQHDRCVVVLRIDFLLEKNDPARLFRTQDGAQENLISRVSALWPRLIRSTVIVSLNFDRDRSEEQRTKQRGRKRSLANKRERERERERESKGKVVQPDPFAETGAPACHTSRRVPANWTP